MSASTTTTQLLVALLALLCCITNAVKFPKPDDNAAASCINWALTGFNAAASVTATCTALDNSQHSTSIALSACVGNNNGIPQCQTNGNAGSTCTFSSLLFRNEFGTIVLEVETSCLDVAGEEITTAFFNLNACLTNNNGALDC